MTPPPTRDLLTWWRYAVGTQLGRSEPQRRASCSSVLAHVDLDAASGDLLGDAQQALRRALVDVRLTAVVATRGQVLA